MKKYDIYLGHENDGDETYQYIVKEISNDGEWVDAEEAEALEQLNKEMLEVLKEASALFPSDEESLSFYTYDVQKFVHNLQSIITKAERA